MQNGLEWGVIMYPNEDLDKEEIKVFNGIVERLEEDLELKLAIIKHLQCEMTEQIYINKLNYERDE